VISTGTAGHIAEIPCGGHLAFHEQPDLINEAFDSFLAGQR
jgi:pimeloyl-ACP methyl ester carboxylesterase